MYTIVAVIVFALIVLMSHLEGKAQKKAQAATTKRLKEAQAFREANPQYFQH